MYYHMLSQELFIYCWTILFTGVINGITSSIANAGPAATPAAAEKTITVSPGGLMEWNEQDDLWNGYPSAKWIGIFFLRILFEIVEIRFAM